MQERTLLIVKPDAVKKNVSGEILRRGESAGLKIVAAKMIALSKAQAQGFYAVHKERPFFDSLATFMSSGPVLVAVELAGRGNDRAQPRLMPALSAGTSARTWNRTPCTGLTDLIPPGGRSAISLASWRSRLVRA